MAILGRRRAVRRADPDPRRRRRGHQVPRRHLRQLVAVRDRALRPTTPGSGSRSAALISITGIALAYLGYIRRAGVTAAARRAPPAPARLPVQQVVLRRAHRRARLPADDRDRALLQRGLRAVRDPGDRQRRPPGVVKGAGSVVRGAQSGFVRAYALLLVGGFAALGHLLPGGGELMGRSSSSLAARGPPMLNRVAVDAARRRAGCALVPRGRRGGSRVARGARRARAGDRARRRLRPGAAGLQHVVDESWIPDLGVRYQLGVDGISVFLVLLTAVLWFAVTLWSALRGEPGDGRERLYYFLVGLAETAALGAFLAQDLLLFVLFFDLMLIPFFFLIGTFGGREPDRRDDEDDRLHAGRLAADAGRRDRHRDPRVGLGRRAQLLDPGAAGAPAVDRQPGVDLLLLRRGVPGQDAGLPDPRLDAGRLPRGAAAGADPALRGALEGRRLRLPARRAAAVPDTRPRTSRSW